MRRLGIAALIIFLLTAVLPSCSFSAGAMETSDEIITFEDGSYIIITTTECGTRSIYTKIGTKKIDRYDGNDNLNWTAILQGTFLYTGSTSTCTDATCEVTIYDSDCYVVSNTASKSGSTASASVTMGRKVLGVTISKDTYSLSLSCDKNGNLS